MMLPLCKCYRYLIYRLYHFRDDTPITNVLVTLATVHLFQFLTILIVIDKCTPFKVWPGSSEPRDTIEVSIFLVLHYILFYNKKKWGEFDVEFKDETPKHKRIGFWLVILYLVGSIIISFGIMVWVCS